MPEPALTIQQFGGETVLLCHFVLTNEMNRSDFCFYTLGSRLYPDVCKSSCRKQ